MVSPSPSARYLLAHPTAGALALEQLAAQAEDYAAHAKAPNTVKAYRADWLHFSAWCAEAGVDALPASPVALALYLADLAQTGRKVATIRRRIASIAVAHKTAGHESPTTSPRVKLVWAGIRRMHGTPQEGRDPVLVEDLQTILVVMATTARSRTAPFVSRGGKPPEPPYSVLELRDRALLLLGFGGAFRRSELVALDWDDLTFTRAGCTVRVNRSKTDQDGQGRDIGIPRSAFAETCAVRALEAYFVATGRRPAGPVFRSFTRWGVEGGRLSDRGVALVVKRRAADAGLDATRLAGHSLRSGFATSAIRAGVTSLRAMTQTGHKSEAVFRKYVRAGSLFLDNPLAEMGL
jgi:site-specific recombinase XerD